jgi:uncharacterized membrane protein
MPVLLLAYPVLVHLAVLWGAPRLEWLALVVMCAIPLYWGLRALRPGHWLSLLALAGLLHVLTRMGGGMYALFVPSVVTPAAVLAVFAGSLRAGQVPVATRLARLSRDALEPEVLVYTRRVTALWVLILAAIAVGNAALALFAPLPVWSLFSNFVNYLLVGLVFVLEYLYRRLRFPTHVHSGFLAHLRLAARTDYKAA